MPIIYIDSGEAYPVWDFYTEEEKEALDWNLEGHGYVPLEITDLELAFITKAFEDNDKAQDLLTKKWKEQHPQEEEE